VQKSLYSHDQVVLKKLLRDLRQKAGLKQEEVAAKLKTYQTFVSKYESGERVLDLPELRQICHVFGLSLLEFVQLYEEALGESEQEPE
jgi:transcriptional regulator with XRE-family HTH domain